MKKIVASLSMLVFIAICGLAQNVKSKYYYYYKNEKQFLELNTDFAFVSVTGDETKNTNLFGVGKGTLKKEGLSDKMKQKLNLSDDFYWAELKLSENTSNAIYNEKVTALRQKQNVQIVSPYFKSPNSKKIGLTNFFYVKLKSTTDIALLEQYAKQTKCIIVKQDDFMPLWYVLSCTKSSDKNAMELANQFFESGLFQFAEPDLMEEDILNCVNDTYFPQQWGLRNTGQYGGNAGIDIRACDAWNISTGSNIIVAVIDQGIQLDHPDLQANIHSLSYDTESRTSPSIVRGDHGTACAGIIGAVGNTVGVRGVAPNCRLMSVSNSLDVTTISRMKRGEGINWAVQNGAHIISNSWESSVPIQIIEDAITNALTSGRGGLGCVVVFAAGNNNGVVSYPANSNPNILTVGAISQCGQRKSTTSCDTETDWGSNFGATLDIVAPGVLIPTTDRTGTDGNNPNWPLHTLSGGTLLSTEYTNNDYTVWFNGTSSACPHVAGVAALMLSVNPSLTGQQVRDIIEQTAQKVGGYNYTTTTGRTNGTWHNEVGYGLVNALCAVSLAQMSLTSISGPDVVSEFFSFYSAQNLPPGCSVSWNQSDNLIRRCTQGSVFCEFVPSDSFPAPGWIEATITNPCGSITLPRKTVWLGVPDYSKLSIELQNGHLTSCNYTSGTAKYLNAPWPGIDAYEWYMPNASNWTIEEEALSGITNKYVEIYYWENPAPSYEDIYIRAHNRSGWSEWQHTSWPTVSCNGYLMILSPNPVTDEATIKLVNKKDNTPIEFTEWDYEIYDSMQGMKEKKTKLKSAETKINTSGWKDGIYIIRAMIDKELVTGKLVVKH